MKTRSFSDVSGDHRLAAVCLLLLLCCALWRPVSAAVRLLPLCGLPRPMLRLLLELLLFGLQPGIERRLGEVLTRHLPDGVSDARGCRPGQGKETPREQHTQVGLYFSPVVLLGAQDTRYSLFFLFFLDALSEMTSSISNHSPSSSSDASWLSSGSSDIDAWGGRVVRNPASSANAMWSSSGGSSFFEGRVAIDCWEWSSSAVVFVTLMPNGAAVELPTGSRHVEPIMAPSADIPHCRTARFAPANGGAARTPRKVEGPDGSVADKPEFEHLQREARGKEAVANTWIESKGSNQDMNGRYSGREVRMGACVM